MFLGANLGETATKFDLTGISLPSGMMSFGEARLIIECSLAQITTPDYPDDFYAEEAKEYMQEPYKDSGEYRKYVFREITHVWVKKEAWK